MGPPAAKATSALAGLLDPARPQLAVLAARALGRIGPGAGDAAPALVKLVAAEDAALAFEASRALCRIAPADAATREAAIDAVIANPWYVRLGGATSARRNCGRTITLAYLGKDAIPPLLAKAKAIIAAGKATPKGWQRTNYTAICELAAAAHLLDPASAADFLPVLGKIPNKNPPVVDRELLAMTTKDLQGKLDQRDPHGRHAAKKKAEEERKKAEEERKKAEEEIDL
jgi:hypothetical protein